MKTVVGVFSSVAEANKVKSALQSEGYETEHIKVIDQTAEGYNTTGSGESFTEKVKGFFSSFSDHQDEHDHYQQYASRLSSGGALLAVTVPAEEAEETADLLYQHGATGIQGEATQATGVTEATAVKGEVAGEQVIPIVQEDLLVGKRQVDRGGVRIYSHMVETPVSADVTLHDERVVVDRRPVNRAATEADFNTGSGVVEMMAVGEEAVVGKTSRVVEEVSIGKQATERTEEVHDTLRHTEVDVEQLAETTDKQRY